MNPLEQLAEDIIIASSIKRENSKQELKKELLSHFIAEKRELELQGYTEDEILEKIFSSFGDIKAIGTELHKVHSNFTKIEKIFWLLVYMYLSGVLILFFQQLVHCRDNSLGECIAGLTILPTLGGVMFMLPIFVFFNYFGQFFCIVTLVAFYIVHSFVWFFKRFVEDATARKRVVVLIFSSAIILNWLSVLFSLRPLPVIEDHTIYDQDTPYIPQPVEIAGFPLKTFYFPPPPMGNDQVPFYMWKSFYINYAIWFGVSIILYFLFLKKYKENFRIVTIFTLIAVALSLSSLNWLVFQFY